MKGKGKKSIENGGKSIGNTRKYIENEGKSIENKRNQKKIIITICKEIH